MKMLTTTIGFRENKQGLGTAQLQSEEAKARGHNHGEELLVAVPLVVLA